MLAKPDASGEPEDQLRAWREFYPNAEALIRAALAEVPAPWAFGQGGQEVTRGNPNRISALDVRYIR
jgi:hypothetical protein